MHATSTIVAYQPAPKLVLHDENDPPETSTMYSRQADANLLRRSPYQALSGCEFDVIWRKRNEDPKC